MILALKRVAAAALISAAAAIPLEPAITLAESAAKAGGLTQARPAASPSHKKTPAQATAALRRLATQGVTPHSYEECYPSSDHPCTDFVGICAGLGGGVSQLPGGGYGCFIAE